VKKTRLIQRVSKPRPVRRNDEGKLLTNPFAFGGGMRDGGLGHDAMELLVPIFSFEYMGASEFEHGAVPLALSKIVEYWKAGDLEFEKVDVKLKDIYLGDWVPKSTKIVEAEKASYWVVCSKTDKTEVLERMDYLVKYERAPRSGKGSKKPHPEVDLKESFGLGNAMKTVSEWDRVLGGLELNNGFFATCDEEMATKFYGLFKEAPDA